MPVSSADNLSSLVSHSLATHLERVKLRVHALVEPLTADELWRRPFPYGNSVGHLLLHLTGNLSYYIGARIAGTGYVRDRPKEFADPARRAKDDVLGDFDQAVERALAALATQREADWQAPFSAVGAEDVETRLGMFVRCVAHADHHAGQMIYLCRQLALGSPAASTKSGSP